MDMGDVAGNGVRIFFPPMECLLSIDKRYEICYRGFVGWVL